MCKHRWAERRPPQHARDSNGRVVPLTESDFSHWLRQPVACGLDQKAATSKPESRSLGHREETGLATTPPTPGLLTQSSQNYPTESPCGTVKFRGFSRSRFGSEPVRSRSNGAKCVKEMASTEQTTNRSPVRWTEEEVHQLSETDTRLLMQMATLRSTPHDLFIIRWCTAHLRALQDVAHSSNGRESRTT